MTLIADFKARFPEFDATLVDANLPRLEAVYKAYFNKEYLAGVQPVSEAILNLLAHLLVVDTSAAASPLGSTPAPLQEATSTSVETVSQSFAGKTDSTDRTDFLRSTKYGQTFLLLAKTCGGVRFT